MSGLLTCCGNTGYNQNNDSYCVYLFLLEQMSKVNLETCLCVCVCVRTLTRVCMYSQCAWRPKGDTGCPSLPLSTSSLGTESH